MFTAVDADPDHSIGHSYWQPDAGHQRVPVERLAAGTRSDTLHDPLKPELRRYFSAFGETRSVDRLDSSCMTPEDNRRARRAINNRFVRWNLAFQRDLPVTRLIRLAHAGNCHRKPVPDGNKRAGTCGPGPGVSSGACPPNVPPGCGLELLLRRWSPVVIDFHHLEHRTVGSRAGHLHGVVIAILDGDRHFAGRVLARHRIGAH